MDSERDYIIKLTTVVYKVTDRLPDDEPLKFQIRRQANEILSSIIANNPNLTSQVKEGLISQIKVLSAYFDIAQAQNWVDSKNFLVLKREYYTLLDRIASFSANKSIKKKREVKRRKTKSHLKPEDRQKMIIDVLEKKKEISLAEIRHIFPEIGARTLRRDLKVLASREDIQKIRAGRKDVIYRLLPQTDHKQLFAG